MKYIISNNDSLKHMHPHKFVYFNPFGFSKSRMEKLLEKVIKDNNIKTTDYVEFYMDDYLFGNRSKFIFNLLKEKYKFKVSVLKNFP